MLEGTYAKGQKVSDFEMEQLNIEYAEICAQWNYTLRPRAKLLSPTEATLSYYIHASSPSPSSMSCVLS